MPQAVLPSETRPACKTRAPPPCSGFELGKVVRSTEDVGSDTTTLSNNILTNPSWGIITALAFGLGITGKERSILAWEPLCLLEVSLQSSPQACPCLV